ncbi:MAG: hypothetical protein SA339_09500 [Methanomassiliicoccus sp.]|nr:hypothetical protein [Methanomassiliicoccus sp.]
MGPIARFFKALVGATWLFSMLMWSYIVLRIVINGVDVHYPFIDSIPAYSIELVGAASFGLAFLSMLTYLTLWGSPLARRRNGT